MTNFGLARARSRSRLGLAGGEYRTLASSKKRCPLDCDSVVVDAVEAVEAADAGVAGVDVDLSIAFDSSGPYCRKGEWKHSHVVCSLFRIQ